MLSQTTPHITSKTAFFNNIQQHSDQIQNNSMTLLKKAHHFTISGKEGDPVVEINLQHNDLSKQGVDTVKRALSEVYKRFTDKCLVTQGIRDLISKPLSVIIELYGTAGEFEAFEVNKLRETCSSHEHDTFSAASGIINPYPKTYPVNTRAGYTVTPKSLYDSKIKLFVRDGWLNTIKHEFGHSLTIPILNSPSLRIDIFWGEGFAESLCNNLPFLRCQLREIALSIQNRDHERFKSLDQCILYSSGHLLINYWLEHYTPSFADIVLAMHDNNVDEVNRLLDIFEDKEEENFAKWMQTLLNLHSLESPMNDDLIYDGTLKGTEITFNEIIPNIEPIHAFLTRYKLNQFKEFKEKISTLNASESNMMQSIYNTIENIFDNLKAKSNRSNMFNTSTNKLVQSLYRAIENIQVPILRSLFEKHQWITLQQLFLVTPEQRFYFTHFTPYLEHTKAAYPLAKTVLEFEKSNFHTLTIDTLFQYYYNYDCQFEITDTSLNTLCKVLSSCIQTLADKPACHLILEGKITLKEAITQRAKQQDQAINYNTIFSSPQIEKNDQSLEKSQRIEYEKIIISRFLTVLFQNKPSSQYSDLEKTNLKHLSP